MGGFRRATKNTMSSAIDSSQIASITSISQYVGDRAKPALHSIARSELLKRLSEQPLIWLNAHAGFGKTQLMLQLADQHEQNNGQVLWLNLNDKAQQEHYFIALLIACTQQQLSLDERATALLTEAQQNCTQDIEQALLSWLTCLLETKERLFIALDDVHLLGEGQSWQLLIRILELIPSHCQMVLAGRYLPAATGRLRLLNKLQWLQSNDLRYSETEIQIAIKQHGLTNNASQVQNNLAYLQGWPAGLSIWLTKFSRLHPYEVGANFAEYELDDYLTGEVLESISKEMLVFLRELAVIGQFNEPLLNNHYGNDNYHPLLMEAIKLNLFIQPVLKTSGWYQMHPVMSALLAKQLPLIQRHEIHKKTFQWLSRQPKQAVPALRHALAADMAMEVQEWVLQESEYILASQDFSSLLAWIQQLGCEFLEKSPRLLVIACVTYIVTQMRDDAFRVYGQLQKSGYLQPAEQDALSGSLARMDNNLEQANLLCASAHKHLPPERLALRVLMSSTLTHLGLSLKKIDDAMHWNNQTQALAQQSQSPSLGAVAQFDLLRIELYLGHIGRCKEIAEQATAQLMQSPEGVDQVPAGRLFVYQAIFGWLTGEDVNKVTSALQLGLRLCLQQKDVNLSLGYALKAVMLANEKYYDDALAILAEAKIKLQQWHVEPFNYQWLYVVQINILLSQNKVGFAQNLFKELLNDKKFTQLPKPEVFPLLPEITMITQARLYLMTGQTDACLELIDVAKEASNNAVFQHLLGLLKAVSLQRFGGAESQQLLYSMMRLLEREKISIQIFNWLPLQRALGSNDDKDTALNTNLSDRELQVLKKIAEGLSNQDIADQLYISLHTVKTHARKINIKLAAKNRTQALCRARELALI